MSRQMWDERYAAQDYTYGMEPNDLVRDEAHRIPEGRVLCLAEGEGRNAVFLARLGYQVTAVDFSSVGLRKAERLAREREVSIEIIEADLARFDLGTGLWSGIVSIFAHTLPEIRRRVHAAIPAALCPGGILILEAYRPRQLELGTGGPKDVALLPTLDELRTELAGLELLIARETDREIHEGRAHSGPSATVQVVGRRRT
ncbi:MAG TPA: class I SAM-dependent methyltransferase [Kofleriaceae bacterium]|nr:class I SAM-dependent methyltransferase [Kofleriaceae bacterium]